ncbi:MAG: hypothetical protein QOD62_511 [Actinomycetota bacterium]|nr:hypothetical protein [Actinomycetota bacterium]
MATPRERGRVAYEADSVANSLGDLGACCPGYDLASRPPVGVSIAPFLGLEAALTAAYRDHFTLDVPMAVFPVRAVKHWQTAG